MEIFRFNNSPSLLKDCWQKSIISTCTLPVFDEDILYVLNELGHERKYWFFGFTRPQFIKACKIFKQSLKYCTDKSIAQWSSNSKLEKHIIDEKHIYIFNDQVLFDIRKTIKK